MAKNKDEDLNCWFRIGNPESTRDCPEDKATILIKARPAGCYYDVDVSVPGACSSDCPHFLEIGYFMSFMRGDSNRLQNVSEIALICSKKRKKKKSGRTWLKHTKRTNVKRDRRHSHNGA